MAVPDIFPSLPDGLAAQARARQTGTMSRLLALSLALALPAACVADETLTRYAGAGSAWQLRQIDGAAFAAEAVLSLPEAGRISGSAPCNTFTASQSAAYPWFQPGPIAATRRLCAAQAEEKRFFGALQEMTLAEVAGDILILSNEAGREMVFDRVQD